MLTTILTHNLTTETTIPNNKEVVVAYEKSVWFGWMNGGRLKGDKEIKGKKVLNKWNLKYFILILNFNLF